MTIPDEAVQAMPERIYAMPKSDTKHCVVAFDEASLDYHIEYVRADLAAPFLQGVKVKERVFVVTALAQTSEKTGWRSRIIGAANIDEAIGRGLRAFEAGEQGANFCVPGAIEISAETLATAGILSAIEVSALEPSPRAQALEEAAWNKAIEQVVIELETNWPHKTTPEMRDAIRALSSQPVADGWLPIETAPIGNGSNRFLAYITGHGPCVCYRNANGTVLSVDGRTILRANHWRPLPAAPGASDTRPTGGSDADA